MSLNLDSPCIAIAPDSFKGTLTAQAAAAALARGLAQTLPQSTRLAWPMADGGEGTLAAFQSILGGELSGGWVCNAVGLPHRAAFYRCELNHRPTAIVEVAQVVGITDETAMARPVLQRTTLGVGYLMRQALDLGDRQFYIGLGGSCTNDGGAGLLVGLGMKLLDRDGQTLPPTPEGLAQLVQVDASGLDSRLCESRIQILSDVNNPLCGATGATHTFGPQKGLRDEAERDRLDAHLLHFATLAEQAMAPQHPRRATEQPLYAQPGTGAAGGLGFALQLLGGIHGSGAQFMAELLKIPHHLNQVDWLITGEGCSDRQTLQGKAPWVVAQMAQAAGVPVTLLSGSIVPEDRALLATAFQGDCFSLAPGLSCCFPASDAPASLQDCCQGATHWLQRAGAQLGRHWIARCAALPCPDCS